MAVADLITEKRPEILQLAERHGAYNVRLFGSVARRASTPESDIDILVDTLIRPGMGGDFLDLWEELEQLLGRKVDLITERSFDDRIRETVLADAIPL